jgi:hypothetical protein
MSWKVLFFNKEFKAFSGFQEMEKYGRKNFIDGNSIVVCPLRIDRADKETRKFPTARRARPALSVNETNKTGPKLLIVGSSRPGTTENPAIACGNGE